MSNTQSITEQRDKIIQAAAWKADILPQKIDSRLRGFLELMEHRKKIANEILTSPLQFEEVLIPLFEYCNENIKKLLGL